MDESREIGASDNRKDRENPQHESTSDLQTRDETGDTLTADSELDHTVQGPRIAEERQHQIDDESVSKEESAEVAGSVGGHETTENGSQTAAQMRLISEVKHQSSKATDTQFTKDEHSLASTSKLSHIKLPDHVVEDFGMNDVQQEPESGTKPLSSHDTPPTATPNDLPATSNSGSRTADRQEHLDIPLNHSAHAQGRDDLIKTAARLGEQQKTHSIKDSELTDTPEAGLGQSDERVQSSSNRGRSSADFDEPMHDSIEGAGCLEEDPADKELGEHQESIGIHEAELIDWDFDVSLPTVHHENREGEGDYEVDNRTSGSHRNAQGLWKQDYSLFGEDFQRTRFTHTPEQPKPLKSPLIKSNMGQQQLDASHHAPQPPPNVDDTGKYKYTADYLIQYERKIEQLERQREQTAKNLHAAQQRSRQMPKYLDQGRHDMRPDLRNCSNNPQNGYQYAGFTQYPMSFPNPGHLTAPHGLLPPAAAYHPFPSHGYVTPRQPPIPLTPDDWQSSSRPESMLPTVERPAIKNRFYGDNMSDDDEPLKTRVRRHPSIVSQDSVISNSSPPRASEYMRQGSGQGHNSDIDSIATKPKPEPGSSQKLLRKHRPAPGLEQEPTDVPSTSPPDDGIGSWKLPDFEVQRQPIEKKDDVPSVKVSIPNLVREELLLSADHHEQEVHLLINIFLSGQEALEHPDPAPATALLNFHTIAVMVIEAYVQFEIGDELGLGRGHFHQNHKQDEEEYERMLDAKDANVDEIFFAVIDRWRAGLESRKKPLLLIRGVQEFCDIALEIIYYIKEHGLLKPEPKARRVRSDKGAKRGSRNHEEGDSPENAKVKGKGRAVADEEIEENRGVKRGETQKVNTLEPRKKAKTEKVTKAKAKRKAPEIIVRRRK